MLYSKAIAMTALSDLKPTQKFLVMNLLADAGFDVSDWANYDGEHPASNPKYCYNWSFEQPGEMFALPGNGMTLGGRELGSQAIPNREFEKPPLDLMSCAAVTLISAYHRTRGAPAAETAG
jgi:hypothetical protein